VFSTFSSGDDLKPALVASVSHILEVASSEARQVSSKAPQSASISSSSPLEAAEAARAMLALTLPTKPLAEAILNDKAPEDQVACLHRAFIQVSSWCISLVLSDSSFLQYALDLARRARDLSLPLHLFLYRSLVAAIARHSKEEDPISTILEASALAVSALNIPLSASFFSDALVALVERNQIQKAIDLMGVMEERHDIVMLDGLTAMAILGALQEVVLKDPSRQHIDGSTACTLLTMISGPLIQSVDYSNVEPLRQALEDAVESLMRSESEDEDEDDYDYDSGEETDGYYDRYDNDEEDMEEEVFERLVDECAKTLQKFDRYDKETVEVLQTLGEDVDIGKYEKLDILPPLPEFQFHDETDDMTKEMIYLRTSKANIWMLPVPDVTDQLVQLSRGEDVVYTREYEEEIFKEMVDSQENYY
jgi:hypothetical protein